MTRKQVMNSADVNIPSLWSVYLVYRVKSTAGPFHAQNATDGVNTYWQSILACTADGVGWTMSRWGWVCWTTKKQKRERELGSRNELLERAHSKR